MSNQKNDNFQNNTNKVLDNKTAKISNGMSVAYASVQEACDNPNLAPAFRNALDDIWIFIEGIPVAHRFQGGILQEHLLPAPISKLQLPVFKLSGLHFTVQTVNGSEEIIIKDDSPVFVELQAAISNIELTKASLVNGIVPPEQLQNYYMSPIHFANDGITNAIVPRSDGPLIAPLTEGIASLTTGKSNRQFTYRDVTASTVLQLGDINDVIIRINSASDTTTVTLPKTSTLNLSVGSVIGVLTIGAGVVEFIGEDVTVQIQSPDDASYMRVRYSYVVIIVQGPNLYSLSGDLIA